MRILFLAHRIPYPPNKGDKIRAFWELQTLAKRHDVDLFCFYDDPEDEQHVSQLGQYCRRFYVEKVSYSWSRARAICALVFGKPFSAAFFSSPSMTRQIRAALDSAVYDKIFVFSSSMAQYVESAGKTSKVLDLVDVDSNKWEQYGKRSRLPLAWVWRQEAKRLAAYESHLVRSFSTTLVCTEAEARLLRSIAPTGEIQVMQNFLSVDEFDPAQAVIPDHIRSLQPYVLFSGSMDYLPNVDAVNFFWREAFPLIRRESPSAKLVIAGRNPRRSIAALRSDPAVHVTGTVRDMKPYIWGASAAVVPMRIARGVQNKILEALAGGVPVVSTTAAANALPISLRSLLLVADSPQEISAAVVKLLRRGPDISPEELRAALKSYIENLDLQAQLEHLMGHPAGSLETDESFMAFADRKINGEGTLLW